MIQKQNPLYLLLVSARLIKYIVKAKHMSIRTSKSKAYCKIQIANNKLPGQNKTTCTLFTPDHAEYTSNLDLSINNKALPMAMHPKVLGLTLDPKLTYSTHIHNISVQAHKPLQIIKALTATGWGNRRRHSWLPIKQL